MNLNQPQILQLEDGDSIFTEESNRNAAGADVPSMRKLVDSKETSAHAEDHNKSAQNKYTQSENKNKFSR